MNRRIVLLSGPICCGKTSLGNLLVERYGAKRFKTNQLIEELEPNVLRERESLQEVGERLDRRTKGQWVCDALVRHADELEEAEIVIVDAVRIRDQIRAIRRAYGSRVIHIHLTASDDELKKRYKLRKGKFGEFSEYEEVRKSQTEELIEELAVIADTVVETDRCTEQDVLVRASAHLDLYSRATTPLVDVIVGGQYGSEGKGNVAAYIAPEYNFLLRVGGPNAGHKVYGDPVRTYHHLPSGTDRCDAGIILGAGATINVPNLLEEISHSKLSHRRLTIDPQAMIISDEDIQVEESDLKSTISSTAQGVGRAEARRINERGLKTDVRNGCVLAKDVNELKPYVRSTQEVLDAAFANNQRVLIEGTQGTSLSLYHGQYPFVTSRDTTVSGCIAQCGVAPRRIRNVIMVCRTLPIRVGGPSGPMSQQISLRKVADRSGLSYERLRKTEKTSTTKRDRRIAEFDWEQLRRSSILNGPTDIALTFVDYIDGKNEDARRFEQLTPETINFIEEVERVSGAPVSLISTRFHYRNIIDRRAW